MRPFEISYLSQSTFFLAPFGAESWTTPLCTRFEAVSLQKSLQSTDAANLYSPTVLKPVLREQNGRQPDTPDANGRLNPATFSEGSSRSNPSRPASLSSRSVCLYRTPVSIEETPIPRLKLNWLKPTDNFGKSPDGTPFSALHRCLRERRYKHKTSRCRIRPW
jgi:hypothetical protein